MTCTHPLFFTGWHQPNNGESGCKWFEYCMVSVNRLLSRKIPFAVNNWILDSGAFTRICSGKGHLSTRKYAAEILRWKDNGNLMAAVTQDYMCEPFILAKTGLTVRQHQQATIARYDTLIKLVDGQVYLMPVLQGYEPREYADHVRQYGNRLTQEAWVGVGSVCKRNSNPSAVAAILQAIHQVRPDLRLHGFGLKKTALQDYACLIHLYSADSQAHSFRPSGGSSKFCTANDPIAALEYRQSILSSPVQLCLI